MTDTCDATRWGTMKHIHSRIYAAMILAASTFLVARLKPQRQTKFRQFSSLQTRSTRIGTIQPTTCTKLQSQTGGRA